MALLARGFLLFGLAGLADGFLIYFLGILRTVEGWAMGVFNLAFVYAAFGLVAAAALLGLGHLPPLRSSPRRVETQRILLALGALLVPAVRYANFAFDAGPASPLALATDAVLIAGFWFLLRLAARRPPVLRWGVPGAILVCACAAGAAVAAETRARQDHVVVQPAARTPNVLWILVDTLRADHLGCYGYPRPTSPQLDAFAASAVVYERAIAQAPWTAPSVASFLSSTYPTDHGCTARNPMFESVATAPEMLRSLGYRTHMIAENPVVSGSYNLTQGCDRYWQIEGGGWEERTAVRHRLRLFRRSSLCTIVQEFLPEEVLLGAVDPLWLTGVHLDAWVAPDGVTDLVTEIFRAHPDGGAFVYLHWSGPHDPYAADPEWEAKFREPDYAGQRWMSEIRAPYPPTDLDRTAPAEYRDVVNRYDAKIAQYDDEMGRLFASLRAENLLDPALILIHSDHGEEFLEHGGWQHGHSLYSEMVHVPLIVRLPGGAGAGARIAEPVELVDLVPTVLDVLGAEVRPNVPWRGQSLHRDGALHGQGGEWAFSAGDLSFDGTQGLKYGLQESPAGKAMIVHMAREDAREVARVEWFDVLTDPGQAHDLWDQASAAARDFLARVRERMTEYGADRNWAEIETSSQSQLEEIQHDLREIGYVD